MNPRPQSGAGFAPLVGINLLSAYGISAAMNESIASSTWPAAKRVLYFPFRVPQLFTARQMAIRNGTVVSGNLDIGVYARNGVRLSNSGSVAQSGTSARQLVDIPDILLAPAVYYMALTFDNATATLNRAAAASFADALAGLGALAETTGSFGLPAQATFAAIADNFLPILSVIGPATI